MAKLNVSIRSARASGAEPNDLLDSRQGLQDQIATLTGATPVPDGQGDVSMVLSGVALVSADSAAQLVAQPDPANGGHLAVQAILADGTGPVSVPSTGGQLGGVLAARDGALKAAADSLDTLAFDFGNAVNAVHQAGYGLDGSTGNNLFTVSATAPGAAGSIAVDASVLANPDLLATASSTAQLPGDATNVFALIGVENQSLSTGQTAENGLAQTIADFGFATQRASTQSQQEAAVKSQLTQMRESTSGVSIDDELVELTRAQRAYEAVSRVITTSNDMLDTLMKLGT